MLVVFLVGLALNSYAVSRLQPATDRLLMRAFQPGPPPARILICRAEMSEGCAQDAAGRSGLAVAWIPAPKGYRFTWMLADRGERGFAEFVQHFASAGSAPSDLEISGQVSPMSNIDPGPPSERIVGTVTNGIDTATIRMSAFAGSLTITEITWIHGGVTYTMSRVGPGADTAALVSAWRSIRYTEPGPAGKG